MKGILISVNSIPHVYSEFLHMAFELSIQDRNELKDDWLGSECMFNTELGYAKIIPDSIIPISNKFKTKHNEQSSRTNDSDS
jgi:hypothetical protein